nr:MetaGeneMark_Unknown Function [uncultured bacterium]
MFAARTCSTGPVGPDPDPVAGDGSLTAQWIGEMKEPVGHCHEQQVAVHADHPPSSGALRAGMILEISGNGGRVAETGGAVISLLVGDVAVQGVA